MLFIDLFLGTLFMHLQSHNHPELLLDQYPEIKRLIHQRRWARNMEKIHRVGEDHTPRRRATNLVGMPPNVVDGVDGQ